MLSAKRNELCRRIERGLRPAVFLAALVCTPAELHAESDNPTYGRNCVFRVPRHGCAPQDLCDVEYRNVGRDLAYDALLHDDPRPFWDLSRIDKLADGFNKMAGELRLSASDIDLGYQSRVLSLDVSEDLRGELRRVLAPGFRENPKRALPERFGGFEEAVRRFCVLYVYVDGPQWPHVFAILPWEANPIHVLRVLRSTPGVQAAGLAKPWAAGQKARRIATGVEDDIAYLAVSMRSTNTGAPENLYLVAGPMGVRRVPAAEAAEMAEFRPSELPADSRLSP